MIKNTAEYIARKKARIEDDDAKYVDMVSSIISAGIQYGLIANVNHDKD